MDPFAAIMLGGVVVLFVALILIGLFYPGSGADQIDWKPTRSPEVEVQNEIDDLDQMLEAANFRRRRRGEEELTEDSVRESLGKELAESVKQREEYMADLEVLQVLEAKNARRRAKGLPELTVEEFRASMGLDT